VPRRPSGEGRCAEYARFQRIDAAFKAGDLAALRAAVDDPAVIPNGPFPLAIGSCLEYAIYHSPLGFIRTLLELGANPVPPDGDHAGFPPLIAAISSGRARLRQGSGGAGPPGAIRRTDTVEILKLLLTFGADPNQRGINDYTALHMAVDANHREAVEILLAYGVDPRVRTRIDEYETPRELAARAGFREIELILAQAEARFL
jgi:ankyrin repeat protein